jgi:hypothetical protein
VAKLKEEEPEPMTYDEAYNRFDEDIDEAEPTVRVMGYSYDPSLTLRRLDPIAYRAEFLGWAETQNIDTDKLIGIDRLDD